MPQVFLVRDRGPRSGEAAAAVLPRPAVLLPPVLAAAAAAVGGLGAAGTDSRYDPRARALLLAVTAAACLWAWLRTPGAPREARVTVYPLGVQLDDGPAHRRRRPPTFLLREDIRDCVVAEHVMAHRVENVLLFRVRSAEGDLRLVPAFPGMDLDYRDCLRIRNDLQTALGAAAPTAAASTAAEQNGT